jgi:hypothetical protein
MPGLIRTASSGRLGPARGSIASATVRPNPSRRLFCTMTSARR